MNYFENGAMLGTWQIGKLDCDWKEENWGMERNRTSNGKRYIVWGKGDEKCGSLNKREVKRVWNLKMNRFSMKEKYASPEVVIKR